MQTVPFRIFLCRVKIILVSGRRYADNFFKHHAEMLRIFIADSAGYLIYAAVFGKELFGYIDSHLNNIIFDCSSHFLAENIAQIIGRMVKMFGNFTERGCGIFLYIHFNLLYKVFIFCVSCKAYMRYGNVHYIANALFKFVNGIVFFYQKPYIGFVKQIVGILTALNKTHRGAHKKLVAYSLNGRDRQVLYDAAA